MKEKLQGRLFYLLTGIPVILIPVLYLLLSMLTTQEDPWGLLKESLGFLMPFLLLLLIHDRLLMKFLFLRHKTRQYLWAVLLLFTAFVTFSYWYNRPFRLERPKPLHHQPWRETPPDRFRPSTPEWFLDPKKPRPSLPNPVVLDSMIALLLIGSDLALGLLIQSTTEKRRLEVLEHERLQQELEDLKAQINPHFLMNVLNNIHGMVEIAPQKAQAMIMELSALMRYVLYEGACQYIDVFKEMCFISNYIALMSKRYSSRRVQIDLQLPETIPPGRTVPPLLFLVLIENAFKHGISYRNRSTLQFKVTLSEERIALTSINSRGNRPEVPAKEGGIGLVNLRKRLRLLFDDNYRFDIEETEVYYKSTLEIPMRKI